MSSGFGGGVPNDPANSGQPYDQQHPGQQAYPDQSYQQPQYTQPLPAGAQFPDPQPNFPPGAEMPHYGAGQPQYAAQQPYGTTPPPAYGVAQYGGQQSGAAQYQPPGGQPPKKRTGLIIGAVLGVLVLIGGVVTVVLVNSGGSSAGGSSPSSLVEAGGTGNNQTGDRTTSRRAGTSSRPGTSTRPSGNPTPVIPGYKVIASSDLNAMYDVPAPWAKGDDGEAGESTTAIALDNPEYCPGSTARTMSFLTTTPGSDANAAADSIGKDAAKSGYNSERPDASPASPFAAADGSVKGTYMEFSGSWAPEKPGCSTNKFTVFVFAFKLKEGNECGALVLDADRATPGEMDTVTAKKIMSSLRPAS